MPRLKPMLSNSERGYKNFFFFFIFVFLIQLTVTVIYKFLLMTGFKPRTSGIRSDRSTYWATTNALQKFLSKLFHLKYPLWSWEVSTTALIQWIVGLPFFAQFFIAVGTNTFVAWVQLWKSILVHFSLYIIAELQVPA